MPFPLFGMIGGLLATRAGFAVASGFSGRSALSTFARSPLVQGGQFGIGYTGGSYGGYGVSNTVDPLGIHKKSYKHGKSQSLGIMPYGYSYGRRRYRRRYGYSRYSRYRSRYGRRRSYYTRNYY